MPSTSDARAANAKEIHFMSDTLPTEWAAQPAVKPDW
jgi:hypothetical protein